MPNKIRLYSNKIHVHMAPLAEGTRLTFTEAQIILSWVSVKTSSKSITQYLKADKVLVLSDGHALAYLGNDIYLFSSLQIKSLQKS